MLEIKGTCREHRRVESRRHHFSLIIQIIHTMLLNIFCSRNILVKILPGFVYLSWVPDAK